MEPLKFNLFRVVKYPKIKMVETLIFAQYRGLAYNIRRPVNVPQPQEKTLRYRGITYGSKTY